MVLVEKCPADIFVQNTLQRIFSADMLPRLRFKYGRSSTLRQGKRNTNPAADEQILLDKDYSALTTTLLGEPCDQYFFWNWNSIYYISMMYRKLIFCINFFQDTFQNRFDELGIDCKDVGKAFTRALGKFKTGNWVRPYNAVTSTATQAMRSFFLSFKYNSIVNHMCACIHLNC